MPDALSGFGWWLWLRRGFIEAVHTLTARAFVAYARKNIGRRFLTLKQRRPFRPTMIGQTVIVRMASGREFWLDAEDYVAEYNRSGSLRPGDYSGELWCRSYFVSMLAAMLREAQLPKSAGDALERPTLPSPALERKVRALRKRGISKTPFGQPKPPKVGTTVVQYKRDPAVKAWVLEFAQGRCELCQEPAPFKGKDGEPFLELHHVIPLADDGPDQVSNAVAVCPNCHRACHLSSRAKKLTASLYRQCARLLPPA